MLDEPMPQETFNGLMPDDPEQDVEQSTDPLLDEEEADDDEWDH